jgi:nitroreductase
LRKEFHLPDNAVPVCIVPVGYPDGQRFGPNNRRPVESVTYWDDWGVVKGRG